MFCDVCVRFNSGSTAVLEIWKGELLGSSPGLVTETPLSGGASKAFDLPQSVQGDGGGCAPVLQPAVWGMRLSASNPERPQRVPCLFSGVLPSLTMFRFLTQHIRGQVEARGKGKLALLPSVFRLFYEALASPTDNVGRR